MTPGMSLVYLGALSKCYMTHLLIPVTKRMAASLVQTIKVTPPELFRNYFLHSIMTYITYGAPDVFECVDASRNNLKVVTELSVLGVDYPASCEFLDVLKHRAGVACTHALTNWLQKCWIQYSRCSARLLPGICTRTVRTAWRKDILTLAKSAFIHLVAKELITHVEESLDVIIRTSYHKA